MQHITNLVDHTDHPSELAKTKKILGINRSEFGARRRAHDQRIVEMTWLTFFDTFETQNCLCF